MNPVSFCKGRQEARCKRYHWSGIQPFSPASAVPLAASMRRFAPLPPAAHASAYAILAFADGGSRNSSLHPPPEALGISTLAQGSRDSLCIASALPRCVAAEVTPAAGGRPSSVTMFHICETS